MRHRYIVVYRTDRLEHKNIYLSHIYTYRKYTVKAYLGSSRE